MKAPFINLIRRGKSIFSEKTKGRIIALCISNKIISFIIMGTISIIVSNSIVIRGNRVYTPPKKIR